MPTTRAQGEQSVERRGCRLRFGAETDKNNVTQCPLCAQVLSLRLAIVTRGRDGFRPRSFGNISFVCKAPTRQIVVVHAEVVPNRGRYIQAGPRIKDVERHEGIAEYEVEIILAARPDILPLRKAGESIPSDLHPAVLQKRRN